MIAMFSPVYPYYSYTLTRSQRSTGKTLWTSFDIFRVCPARIALDFAFLCFSNAVWFGGVGVSFSFSCAIQMGFLFGGKSSMQRTASKPSIRHKAGTNESKTRPFRSGVGSHKPSQRWREHRTKEKQNKHTRQPNRVEARKKNKNKTVDISFAVWRAKEGERKNGKRNKSKAISSTAVQQCQWQKAPRYTGYKCECVCVQHTFNNTFCERSMYVSHLPDNLNFQPISTIIHRECCVQNTCARALVRSFAPSAVHR